MTDKKHKQTLILPDFTFNNQFRKYLSRWVPIMRQEIANTSGESASAPDFVVSTVLYVL